MQIINFTATEILPKLLTKEKEQTIRPAFKIINEELIQKPQRFKVNDKIKLMWKQRSPFSWFCKSCGEPTDKERRCENESCINHRRRIESPFNKILGTGTIIKVFEIGMEKLERNYRIEKFEINRTPLPEIYPPIHFVFSSYNYTNNDFINDLAQRDGFNSTKEFLDWFHNHYNLTKQKPFWVYRWRRD